MEEALADDLERVASLSDSIELRVSILNGDDFVLSLPRDAPVSELRARVAQAMEAKNPERVRLFHGEAELTPGARVPAVGRAASVVALAHSWHGVRSFFCLTSWPPRCQL